MLKKLIVISLFIWFALIYFWNVGGFSLSSWDEAWFGSISKDIVKKGNFFTPTFNGEPFYDHPPFGFWLQAISQALFGFNEFGVRLPSVIWGILSLYFVYKLGQKWGTQLAGLLAMMILGTCIWFVLRTRSGNLDIIFIGNLLGSLFFATKVKEDDRYLPIMIVFLFISILTKSALGFGVVLLCFIWLLPLKRQIIKKLLMGLIILTFLLSTWILLIKNSSGINPLAKMIEVGSRSGWQNLWNIGNIKNNLFYLHMGVEEWYYPMIIAIVVSLLFHKRKEFKFLWLWVIFYLGIFLLNRKTELWHLIPVYPALALILSLVIVRTKYLKILLIVFIVVVFVRQNIRLINLIKEQRGISPIVMLVKETNAIPGKFYLDDSDLPVAVYYSNCKVYPVKYLDSPFNEIAYLLKNAESGSLVITSIGDLQKTDRLFMELKKIGNISLVILKD